MSTLYSMKNTFSIFLLFCFILNAYSQCPENGILFFHSQEELDGANIGWGAGETSISSKIYLAKDGCETFQTYHDEDDGSVVDYDIEERH